MPAEPRAVIKSLAKNSPLIGGRNVTDAALVGHRGKLQWSQTGEGLAVELPEKAPSEHAIALRIKGVV